ncbi:unnamed protein product [Spirodela intermedia]|uniref:Transcription factor CBF/NF-Y/archaeal histone domain-containing protein n=1 Tax=Spirodela intermedia TaxID=51605 RepID=A0A7I8IX65_SPIIN|nr:unnamed protein product [Spirodela intermedia]CAA6662185.1 unnamed protein product [Spirodela intermedia]
MRKKLDTRFPAARIKKIMQADEDVGKIAMAVPLLVSKALELFLQDLCDRTYDITLQRGAKTMSSLHLKQCVQSFGVFDFLRHIVSKVPDIGHSDTGGEDRPARKRKALEGEDNETDEDMKRSKATGPSSDQWKNNLDARESKEATAVSDDGSFSVVRNFDLNENPDGNGSTAVVPTTSSTTTAAVTAPIPDAKPEEEEYPEGWPLLGMGKMGIDPLQFALSKRPLEDEEEDYDNEDG